MMLRNFCQVLFLKEMGKTTATLFSTMTFYVHMLCNKTQLVAAIYSRSLLLSRRVFQFVTAKGEMSLMAPSAITDDLHISTFVQNRDEVENLTTLLGQCGSPDLLSNRII